jgi:hypothetical protein
MEVMMAEEKRLEVLKAYLSTATTVDELLKFVQDVCRLLQPTTAVVPTADKEPLKRRRGKATGIKKRGPLYLAVQSFGGGGSVREIGNKARELGLRLPPDPMAQDRSVNRKLVQSPHVYKKNEDNTWRLLKQPVLKVV